MVVEFGSVSDARESYGKLGWTVRVFGDRVVVLATGRSVDVLEAPYTPAMLALGRWERDAAPGPIATDGTTAWFLVRSGRYPWRGSPAARAGAVGKALRDMPSVRWHAGTGLPLPPTEGGKAHVWWLVEPEERHLPDADGLPHPLDAADRLGAAIGALAADGRALRIGEGAVLLGAPASERTLTAALAGPDAEDDAPAGRHGDTAEPQPDTQAAEGGGERPRRLDHPGEPAPAGQAPAGQAQGGRARQESLKIRVSWPGSGSRRVRRMEDLVGLLQRLDARTDGQGGLITIEHANGKRLSIGVGAPHSVALWAEEDAVVPYMISTGDPHGTAVAGARADADRETGVMYIVPGGRFAFVPPESAVSADVARRAVTEFAYSGKRPTCVDWTD
jgi:hypothetical protein